ncbi:MAG: PIG-L family deacetylase [Thermoanaerobaculia bacterium]
MIDRLPFLLAAALFFASPAPAAPVSVRPERMDSAAEIRLRLERLGVTGTALYVAAHPDDENTAMIAWLANGKLVRTGYLAVTRGDGGQNLIGTEKGDLLGVIRTHELLEARKIDGGEQFFSRAIDFGYSKTAEETLGIWGKERILADFVRVIRTFRPDVIINRFPSTGEGGHGHHTASAILAEEAFRLAADPDAFREELGWLRPWQAKRIFWNSWRPAETEGLLGVDLGAFNPLLGRSYTELAGESRSMHKSQGFGAPERRGTMMNYLELRGGDPAVSDPFEGIDLTWRRVDGGEAILPILDRAREAFESERPYRIVPHLIELRRALGALPGRNSSERDLIERKIEETDELIRQAAGIWIEAIAATPAVVAGRELEATLSVVNRSPLEVSARKLERGSLPNPLPYNQTWSEKILLEIPKDHPFSHPFWLRAAPSEGAWTIRDDRLIGEAVAPEPLGVALALTVEGEVIVFEAPVYFRRTDPVMGERYRPVEVHPPVIANIENSVIVFPDRETRTVRISASSMIDGASGTIRPVIPEGWTVEPRSAAFALDAGEQRLWSFRLTPPAEEVEGHLSILIEQPDWEPYSLSKIELDYPHIATQTLFPHASAKLVRADIERDGRDIGYVMGAGDEIPDALRQIGYDVTLLSDSDLGGEDLSRFDAIVLGVRAYNTRPNLMALQPRLFEYVRRGGTLVTQYNTLGRDLPSTLAPWPLTISRERVSVEWAPVLLAEPEHPLLTSPNRITENDFEGWIQERGLYFPGSWSEEYAAPLSMDEPGEQSKRGAVLVGTLGEGTFIYTPISFFRQLPAGVPGAYRLFANLVAARNGDANAESERAR